MSIITSGLVIFLIIAIIYFFYLPKPTHDGTLTVEQVCSFAKTGDIISFHATDNNNSYFHRNYLGHIGIVIVYPDYPVPLLFEAANIDSESLDLSKCIPYNDLVGTNYKGIYVSNLRDRLLRYRGFSYYRQYRGSIQDKYQEIREFINFAMNNMYYEKDIIYEVFRKYINGKKCNFGTNCAEIVFLMLIKVGVLPIDKFDSGMFNYLNFTTNKLNEYYNTYRKISVHPFSQ